MFFLFLFHPLGQNRVSSIEYRVSRIWCSFFSFSTDLAKIEYRVSSHQRTSKGLTKSKLPRLPEDVRVGTGAVVAHGWTTAKFPPCERVPLPLLPCPRADPLAALLFGWFVVLLRFTSLYPSRSLSAPLRLGLYVVFMFSPPL